MLKCKHHKMLVASLCFFIAPVFFFSSFTHAENVTEIVTVNRSISSSQTILGSTVVPYREITVTAQTPGKITAIGGEVGSGFTKGAMLAKVDDAQLLAKRNTLWAQITSAQAALKNSQAQHQREIISPKSKSINGMPGMGLPSMMDIFMTRPLYDMMGNSDQGYNRYSDLVNSATGVSQAESQVMMAWSQLNELNTKIKDTVSVAPFEGIIMSKMVEVGDAVQPGQPLMKFGFIKYLRLQADVPSMLVSSLVKGMSVPVRISNKNRTIAKVSQIYPIADPSRHTVVVKFDLPIGVSAAPGMYAEIFLPDTTPGGNSVITIPKTALIPGRSLPTVLVADEETKTSSLRLIRVGVTQSDGLVSVVSGLKVGERVINNPPPGASSGWYPKDSAVL
ncbi:efflux RND transporter periplasmic adaptor subunit [Cocleimonas sp. KMM 6892]|uniref:efflux RND transporter periplasmic adaptor subunit n=1 Tax=unclassified Cocleimonas TaxID=2639732 RepID=UPI002DB8279B|nr:MULTISPECIES: efflux RND transporter periplasmic adaptor subunit [unclassified Cocleimonas]MEB8430970.1 efflux RND transporter periplasmic adaptor subunit [Cocleimonas sp. KMM 6892]MEC4714258.1 efflux RND transporter periplasmic adaptor subunit [Cocleimonas sp. KMM 6895]MEC4743589.1 efflux RND transporter periplasmic adaptor subunit [Cocleimonas sp. KMM 6896]